MATKAAKKKAEKTEEFELSFSHLKDTAGTRRFVEDGEKDDHKVGSLYLKKAASTEMGDPDTLSVTITAG